MKTCQSCRWIEYELESGPYCGSPKRPPDPEFAYEVYVYGRRQRRQWKSCAGCRSDEGWCGMAAKWHEPSPPTVWQRIRAAFTSDTDTAGQP